MKTNVQPGDRAITIAAHKPDNIGKIVRVIDRAHVNPDRTITVDGRTYSFLSNRDVGVIWVIESLGSPFTVFNYLGQAHHLAVTIFDDKSLRRLPDIKEDETVDQDAEVPA